MNLTINPSAAINGTLDLPGDKSISHRAALFCALADGTSHIDNFLVAGVTKAMLDNLSRLGIDWQLDGSNLIVEGKGISGFSAPSEVLNCGNSATTLRLLTGAISASAVAAVLDGSDGLRRRPMKRILLPLQSMGVQISGSAENTAPLKILSRFEPKLTAINFTLQVASAQVKTTILLAALNADSTTTVVEPGPSRDHTERMLQIMGVELGLQKHSVSMQPPKSLKPININIPGDISSAAFLIVAACIVPDSHLVINHVGLNPTRTGLLDALIQMGADIRVQPDQDDQLWEPSGTIVVKYSRLHGINIAGDLVVRMIDEFPIFAVAAAYAIGKTVVSQAEELRYKETDRISLLCQQLIKLGVNITEQPDGFIIQGQQSIAGGSASSHGDHRLAMALSILGLKTTKPTEIINAEIIAESFPTFVAMLNQLGAKIQEHE